MWKLENFHEIHPDTTFWKIVKKYGFPQLASRSFGKAGGARIRAGKLKGFTKDKKPACCFELKEKPRFRFYMLNRISGDIAGLRAAESRMRAIFIGQRGQIYTVNRKWAADNYQPIALWDTLLCERYLRENQIPFNETYRTQKRNGCWACTAYKNWRASLLRYNPRMYRLIQNMRGVKLMDNYVSDAKPSQ